MFVALGGGDSFRHLNVKNLFDQKYYENVGFYNGVFWGDPRTVSVGLEWTL